MESDEYEYQYGDSLGNYYGEEGEEESSSYHTEPSDYEVSYVRAALTKFLLKPNDWQDVYYKCGKKVKVISRIN